MTEYEQSIIMVTVAGERPTHGYEIGQLLFDRTEKQLYQLTARNTHVWTKIRNPNNVPINPIEEKYGKCDFNGTTLRGEGLMSEIAPLGATFSGNAMDANGTAQTFSAGTTSIQNTGVAILRNVASDFNGFTRNSFLPYYIIKTVPNGRTAGDYRLYSGWFKNSNGPLIGETPLSNAEGGVIVGFNSTDTEWKLWYSNGDGVTAITKVPLSPSVPVAASAAQYRIEMIYNSATSITANIYNNVSVLLGSATATTNVLVSGKSINWASIIQNPNTTNKTIAYYAAYMTAIL